MRLSSFYSILKSSSLKSERTSIFLLGARISGLYRYFLHLPFLICPLTVQITSASSALPEALNMQYAQLSSIFFPNLAVFFFFRPNKPAAPSAADCSPNITQYIMKIPKFKHMRAICTGFYQYTSEKLLVMHNSLCYNYFGRELTFCKSGEIIWSKSLT